MTFDEFMSYLSCGFIILALTFLSCACDSDEKKEVVSVVVWEAIGEEV